MRVVSVRVCGRECEHGYVLVRTVELIELINAHLKPFSEFFHRPIKGSRSLLYTCKISSYLSKANLPIATVSSQYFGYSV